VNVSSIGRRSAIALSALALTGVAAIPTVALAGGKKKVANARITGGGSIFDFTGTRITHGFTLPCVVNGKPGGSNLEINRAGASFHMTDLVSAQCFNDPTIGGPGQPSAGKGSDINTYQGIGEGTYNPAGSASKVPAEVRFVLTDSGEPGTSDRFILQVTTTDDNAVVMSGNALLTYGNHQFHFVK
jgi:hypothetical protein